VICALASACASTSPETGDAPPTAPCDVAASFDFSPSIDEGSIEGYSCFYETLDLGSRTIAAIRWHDPTTGPIRLHHATLQVTAEAPTLGAAPSCEPMPADVISLHVHAPGGTALELPPDVGLLLPPAARYFRIEAHALRTGPGAAEPARVEICTHRANAPKLAGWLGLEAPVPAIRPHTTETSTGRCELSSAFHLLSAWPHMHLTGKEFHAAVVRGNVSTPLLDVPSWDFTHQLTYPLDVDLAAHDVIAPTCVWENPTADYVLPGIYTTNEMCTFGLIGWPAGTGCIGAAP
jgi:hypothetical protein